MIPIRYRSAVPTRLLGRPDVVSMWVPWLSGPKPRAGIPDSAGRKPYARLFVLCWRSDLRGLDDLVPQIGILLLVGRPDLLLRELAEGIELRRVHDHALRLEQLLRLGEAVDALGRLAHALLRTARGFTDELLLLLGEAVPHVEVHHEHCGRV